KTDSALGGDLVERLENGALVVGTFRHPDNAIGIHQRSAPIGLHWVFHTIFGQTSPAPVSAASDQHGVFKPASCNETGTRSVPCQNGVVDNGGAVNEKRCDSISHREIFP